MWTKNWHNWSKYVYNCVVIVEYLKKRKHREKFKKIVDFNESTQKNAQKNPQQILKVLIQVNSIFLSKEKNNIKKKTIESKIIVEFFIQEKKYKNFCIKDID